eukprot:m.182177 g.182177  ORF g.182177 m.182177 type:complete len:101 (+) comp14667_c0_seq5:248-550(+)
MPTGCVQFAFETDAAAPSTEYFEVVKPKQQRQGIGMYMKAGASSAESPGDSGSAAGSSAKATGTTAGASETGKRREGSAAPTMSKKAKAPKAKFGNFSGW